VLVALWAARWLVRSHHLYEWDSAQYALGAREYNVVRHQPHPPGYPLWIVLLKTTHWFIGDINTAQVVLSFVCTALATILFYRFVRTIYGAPAALLSASLLLFSPTVCFYNVVASTYPADLLISVLLAALAARLWVGEKRVGPYAVFAVAALAGVRQSGAALMAPLVGIALIRAYRGDVKRWLVGGVIGLATFAAWYLPTALMNGGVAAYQRFTSQAVRIYFSYGSVFFGASREAHLAMLHNVAVWAAVATCVAVVTYALLFLGGKLVGGSASTPSALGPAFFALWLVPNLLYVTLFHCPKPGYLVLSLPPVITLGAWATASSLAAIGARLRFPPVCVAATVGCAAGVAATALVLGRYDDRVNRTTLASVRDADDDMQAIVDRVQSGPGPSRTLIVTFTTAPYGPNVRSLVVELPDAHVAMLDAAAGAFGLLRDFRHFRFHDDDGDRKTIAPEIRRVLWLHLPDVRMPASIHASFPGTQSVMSGRTATLFESDVADSSIDARVTWEGRSYHFVRGGPLAGLRCLLGSGFIDPLDPVDNVWGDGPESTLILHTDEPSTVRITLGVALTSSPLQSMKVRANEQQVAELQPEQGKTVVVELAAPGGDVPVTFEYARWNHHPDDFVARDSRPFAVLFRAITCASGEHVSQTFP